MVFEEEGLADLVVKRLGLHDGPANMEEWRDLIRRVKQPRHEVNIAVVGKYTGNGDAYISIAEALKHGGIASDARVNIEWIECDDLEEPGLDMAQRLGARARTDRRARLWRARGGRQDRSHPPCPRHRACPSSASATACRWP